MTAMATLYDGDTFEFDGCKFRVAFPFDDDREPPWKRCDGHGPVSEWTTRDKRPGERVLVADHGRRRYYDYAAAVKMAKTDGWDAPPYDDAATPGARAARAAADDFDYLRGWCNDEWHYVGVVVTLLDADGEPTDQRESVWGIEDSSGDYLADTARELAGEILARKETVRR